MFEFIHGTVSFGAFFLLFGTQQRDDDNDVLFCGLSFLFLFYTELQYCPKMHFDNKSCLVSNNRTCFGATAIHVGI